MAPADRPVRTPCMRVMALLLATLLLAGCLDESGGARSCAYAVTADLDAGRFDEALARLDSRACEAALDAEERQINRAAAWIGKAGYDIADVLLVALEADSGQRDTDLELLSALGGLGARGGGLRYLERADRAYASMMEAFDGRLDEACRATNVHLLSDLQQDACFFSGLLAYARLARGFDLLLADQLQAFLGRQPLGCAVDSNFSGVVDEGEISACALSARSRLGDGAGVCRAAGGTRDGLPVGAVSWARIDGVAELGFTEAGALFATLVPVRVTVEPGGHCPTGRSAVRLLQPMPAAGTRLALTDGLCETEVTRACAAEDPAAGCWPCPIPRADGQGAASLTDAVLNPVNLEMARWLPVLPASDGERAAEDLERLRERLCEPAGTGPAACTQEDGERRVNRDALGEYLRP